MGTFSDILDRPIEEKYKELQEEYDDMAHEIKELRGEIYNANKRSIRDMDLFKQAQRYIDILSDKLDTDELDSCKKEFDEREKALRQKAVKATLEEDSNG